MLSISVAGSFETLFRTFQSVGLLQLIQQLNCMTNVIKCNEPLRHNLQRSFTVQAASIPLGLTVTDKIDSYYYNTEPRKTMVYRPAVKHGMIKVTVAPVQQQV